MLSGSSQDIAFFRSDYPEYCIFFQITQDIATTVSDSLVQSELSVVVSAEDNAFGATYECRAISSAIKEPLRSQYNFTVYCKHSKELIK